MSRERSALLAAALGALLLAGMGLAIFAAQQLQRNLGTAPVLLVRVLANAMPLLLPLPWLLPQQRPLYWAELRGDRRPALLSWGLLGALTIASSIVSLMYLGPASATLLAQGSQALSMGLLAPRLSGHRVGRWEWIALAGALGGLCLLNGHNARLNVTGAAWAVASGLCATLAYLSAQRCGNGNNSSRTLMLYWTLCSLSALPLLWRYLPAGSWPTQPAVWALLAIGALSAAAAQYMTALAYMRGSAPHVSAMGFLTPVFSLIVGAALFHAEIDTRSCLAAALIVACGGALPLLRASRR